MNFITRLKAKWEITSNWQFLIINVVFAISGSLTVFVRKPIFYLLGIDGSTPMMFRILLYVAIVTPVYFAILIIVATLFGQFRFFWNFEKRFFGRFWSWKSRSA